MASTAMTIGKGWRTANRVNPVTPQLDAGGMPPTLHGGLEASTTVENFRNHTERDHSCHLAINGRHADRKMQVLAQIPAVDVPGVHLLDGRNRSRPGDAGSEGSGRGRVVVVEGDVEGVLGRVAKDTCV